MTAVSSLATQQNTASSAAAALTAVSAPAGSADTAKETNDRFLKCLVAQMNNQDPLNPA